MISLSIDGKKTEVSEGTTVLEAARAAGADIPTLCYHPELRANAACRLCTVEVSQRGRSRLTASCALPAEEGMEIQTASERVLAGRRMVMELLLARCPEVPRLKELAAKMNAKTDRLQPKNDDCILCGLCVGVCSQVLGINAIGFSGRGISKKVTTPFEKEAVDCLACGACTYVCPTGAIKMEQKTIERDLATRAPRYCRYMRMGLIPYALCPAGLDCAHCEVDQRMEDTLGTHPAFIAHPAALKEPVAVNGYSVMPGRYYDIDHVWAEPIGNCLRLGVDDFGRRLMGPVDDVELLKERGAEVKAGEPLWKMKLAKGRSVIMHAPVSGTLLSINEDISLDPTLLSKAPYSRGWICIIRPASPDEELVKLRFKDPAVPHYLRRATDPVNEWLTEETEKLSRALAGQGADVIQDGQVRANLAEVISDAEWQTLTDSFFSTKR